MFMFMSNIHIRFCKLFGIPPSPPKNRCLRRWFQKSFWFSPLKILEDEPTHFDYCAYFSNGLETITQFIMLMSNIHVVLKALGTSPSPPQKKDALGGGFKNLFDFHPGKIGEDEPTHFDLRIFFKWAWNHHPVYHVNVKYPSPSPPPKKKDA